MPRFNDRHHREWNVELTVAGLKRVQQQTDFPLLSLLDDDLKGLAELYDDPVQLVEILYALCEPQVEAAELTPEEFGESFAGEVLQQAANAVVEATAAFYRSPKQGRILRAMRQKIEAGSEHHLDRVAETIKNIDVVAEMDRALAPAAAAEPTPT